MRKEEQGVQKSNSVGEDVMEEDSVEILDDSTEDVNTLEETKGCAILDSGATVLCSSTVAATEIQEQRLCRGTQRSRLR